MVCWAQVEPERSTGLFAIVVCRRPSDNHFLLVQVSFRELYDELDNGLPFAALFEFQAFLSPMRHALVNHEKGILDIVVLTFYDVVCSFYRRSSARAGFGCRAGS